MFVVRAGDEAARPRPTGAGFVTSGEAVLAETRKGKQLVNLRPKARALVKRVPARRTRSR